MKAFLLRLLIALLCLQASWAQALHLSHAGIGHEDHIHAAADHSGHAHERSSAAQEANEMLSECQQQHHHHASCVALIDTGQSTIQKQSGMPLASSVIHHHARLPHSDIDKPKWLAATFV